jgi:16S rRNA (guanine527-N7)-methyltransferase
VLEQDELRRGLLRLGERYGLEDEQVGQLRQLLALLESDPQAPTTVRSAPQALDVHIADALVALELPGVRAAHRIADLGAGAGFPGLALAVALPESSVRLVESQARKCAFMERLVDAAAASNSEVVNRRAEQWAEGMGAHELITARAVGPQSVVLEYAAPLLALSGQLVDWRGRRNPSEEAHALLAAEQLGLRRLEVRAVEPFSDARELHLHVFVKVSATPAGFPRRAGMARKRPLGS